jgi:hypothetical protein
MKPPSSQSRLETRTDLSEAIVTRLAEEIEKSRERAAILMLAGDTTPRMHINWSASTHPVQVHTQ